MKKHIRWAGCTVSPIVQPGLVVGAPGLLRFLPWVLIVQAESDFIDSMCMRHDHIEAILHGETEKQWAGCGKKKKNYVFNTWQHRKRIIPSMSDCAPHRTVQREMQVQPLVYLIVHDCSQAHDAHMHIIFLAHEPRVLDGFAVWNGSIAATDGIKLQVEIVQWFIWVQLCIYIQYIPADCLPFSWLGMRVAHRKWEVEVPENRDKKHFFEVADALWERFSFLSAARWPKCEITHSCYANVLQSHHMYSTYTFTSRFFVNFFWSIH